MCDCPGCLLPSNLEEMDNAPLDPPARLSVVVPTRDRAPMLDQCLASIRALEGPDLCIELIVVDDGSSDGSTAVALAHGAQVIENGGKGSAAARNAGMRAATGEFLLMVDDDDVALAGHVRPHIALLRQHPEFAAVVGQVTNTSFDLQEQGDAWPARLPRDGHLLKSFFHYYPQIGATVARMLVRETVGDQDPALIGDQDWDWHLRLAREHLVGFVPVPCLLFRQRPPSGPQEDGEWRRLSDHARVLWKNARAAGWRTLPPWELAMAASKQRGSYSAAFASYAKTHAMARQRRLLLRAIARSFIASPPHAVKAIATDAVLRRQAFAALTGRHAPLPDPEHSAAAG